jgi:hypothetical protein
MGEKDTEKNRHEKNRHSEAVAANQGTNSMWYLDDGLVFAQSVTAINEALLIIAGLLAELALK